MTEFQRTYEVMKKENLSLKVIIEVVVKSNGLVGVGIVSLMDDIHEQLTELLKGYK